MKDRLVLADGALLIVLNGIEIGCEGGHAGLLPCF